MSRATGSTSATPYSTCTSTCQNDGVHDQQQRRPRSSVPNSSTASGISATDGIGRRNSIVERGGRAQHRHAADHDPEHDAGRHGDGQAERPAAQRVAERAQNVRRPSSLRQRGDDLGWSAAGRRPTRRRSAAGARGARRSRAARPGRAADGRPGAAAGAPSPVGACDRPADSVRRVTAAAPRSGSAVTRPSVTARSASVSSAAVLISAGHFGRVSVFARRPRRSWCSAENGAGLVRVRVGVRQRLVHRLGEPLHQVRVLARPACSEVKYEATVRFGAVSTKLDAIDPGALRLGRRQERLDHPGRVDLARRPARPACPGTPARRT